MNAYKFTQVNFDHPSPLFVFEDFLKKYIGCPLIYNPYIKSFGLRGDEKILDFGCGGGSGSRCLLNFLGSRGHLTCVDISSFWMNKAEKRLSKYQNVGFMVGDIRKLSIKDQTYDVITIMHVIHDIKPSERMDTVHALSQKLKNDGSIFIREPIKTSHGMAIEEIHRLMANAGLWEIEQEISQKEYKGRFLKNER